MSTQIGLATAEGFVLCRRNGADWQRVRMMSQAGLGSAP